MTYMRADGVGAANLGSVDRPWRPDRGQRHNPPFVRIGAGCLIGAGAVGVLDIPQGCVAFGNPAIVRGRGGDLKAIEERAEMVSNSVSRYCSTGSVPLTRNGRRDDRD